MRCRVELVLLALLSATGCGTKKHCCTDSKGDCLPPSSFGEASCCDSSFTVQARAALDDGGCRLAPSAAGNSCTSADTLVVGSNGGFVSASGDNSDYLNHVDCLVRPADLVPTAPEHLYRLSSTDDWAVRGHVDGGTMYFNFSNCSFSTQACGAGWSAPDEIQGVSELALADVPPGDHFLWVEGPGAYDLKLDFFAPPLIHDCSQPVPVSFGGDGGTASESVDLAAILFLQPPPLSREYSVRAYSLYLTQPMRVQTTVTPAPGWSAWVDGASSCSAYAAAPAGAGVTSLDEALPKGFHYVRLLATGDASSVAPFTTTFTATAFPPGNCSVPLVLSPVADGGVEQATVTGDTTGAFAEPGASCASGSPQLSYALTLAAPRNLTATVTTSSATFQPALALRPADCAATDTTCSLAPSPGTDATLSASALPAGDYFVWVSGQGGTGPFTLDVTLTP